MLTSTLSTETFLGNDTATEFPFHFQAWTNTDGDPLLRVYTVDPDGVATLTTDWSVVLAEGGGTLTYPQAPGDPLPTGWKLVILRDMDFLQQTDYVNGCAFNPETMESALDRLTAQDQQLLEMMGRALLANPGGESPTDLLNAGIAAAAEAEAAQGLAEAAQAGAETAQGLAEDARDAATTAQGLAEDARDAAEAARDAFPAAADIVTVNAPFFSRRSRLCNGLFRVDNLNAGAAVTPSSSSYEYVVDNLSLGYSQVSKLTAQRVVSSIAALAFAEKFTVAAAVASPGAADYFISSMGIEGLDFADLRWGTANAKPITIQAHVRVSVAGTYGFVFRNAAQNRSYVFTKDLVAGDNYITQTIPGDTSGTWPTGAECAAYLTMDLGCGSNRETATPNTWVAGNYCRTAACTRLISTAGATYEIGGIQVEEGEFATPLEVLPYAQAEAWCQRYHPVIRSTGTNCVIPAVFGAAYSTTQVYAYPVFEVAARVDTSGVIVSDPAHLNVADGVTSTACTLVAVVAIPGSGRSQAMRFTVASGLTQWRPYYVKFVNDAAYIKFTGAEL